MEIEALSTTPRRLRKSSSFHSGDTHAIKIYTNTELFEQTNPLWDCKPMVKMKISPTAATSPESGNVFSPPMEVKRNIFVFSCHQKKWVVECVNVSLCVLLHVFVMIIFEIYFYFNYVVVIEKAAFLQKIDEYFQTVEKYKYNTLISLDEVSYNRWLNVLYAEYMASRHAQEQLLQELLQKACEIGGAFGIAFLVVLFFAVLQRNQTRWKTILAENIGMLALLGFFEYLFFTEIIMNYNPISDAELEYIVAKKTYDVFANNSNTGFPI